MDEKTCETLEMFFAFLCGLFLAVMICVLAYSTARYEAEIKVIEEKRIEHNGSYYLLEAKEVTKSEYEKASKNKNQ